MIAIRGKIDAKDGREKERTVNQSRGLRRARFINNERERARASFSSAPLVSLFLRRFCASVSLSVYLNGTIERCLLFFSFLLADGRRGAEERIVRERYCRWEIGKFAVHVYVYLYR